MMIQYANHNFLPFLLRNAKSGEKVELLNEATVELKEDTLVIADNESVLAIAGVMGGMDSATQPNSTDINHWRMGRLTRTHEFISYPSRRFKRIVNT
jgi:phenylalanyl-tRNA synthetase beta subunit